MIKNKDRWSALSMSERADLINRMIKKHNISDLKTIRSVYNEYGSGGWKDKNLNYPEVTIQEEPWADAYFKQHPEVAGMAIGGGMNGVTGARRVIINPYSKNINKDAVLYNERSRHYMEENDFKLPGVTQQQMDRYRGTTYQNDTLNVGRTEAARYLSGDKHFLTDEQIKYVNSFGNGGDIVKDTIPMYSDKEGNLYDVLPGVVDIRGLNRKEVKKLAQEIASRDTHEWDVTNRELASGLATVQGKNRDQEARFNKIFEKQYKKNLDYSKQIERAKRAGKGDTSALVDYMNYGQNKVASHIAPLLGVPAASVLASTGVLMPIAKQTFKAMMNPASAKTTAGALAATGLDASGVAFGAAGMGNIVENWMRGDFTPSDIPAFALNTMDVIPGAVAVNAAIGAAQDAKRIRQAAKYINEAVNDINTPRARETRMPATESSSLPEPPRDIITDLNESPSNLGITQLASDLDLDVDTFLRRAPEDMINVEPSHTIEETSTVRHTRAPEQFDLNASEAEGLLIEEPSIAYRGRRITRSEIERLLIENGATQEGLNSILGDFDTANYSGDEEFFWSTSSGHITRSLIPRQSTDFINLRGDTDRLYRGDLERILRDAGYEQDVINEALIDFDRADLGGSPYPFLYSRSGRLYRRVQRGIGRDEIELLDGNIVNVDEASRVMRDLGYNEDAINRLINRSLRDGHPLNTSNPNPEDLTDDGLRIYVDGLDDDFAIRIYANLLGEKKRLDTDYKTGRYRERTRTLDPGKERSFKAFAERMSKVFNDNIDFADLSEDNYVKIKNYLRSRDVVSGDIDHMTWFQMDRSLPRNANGQILITEADGTTRPIMFGERPQYSTKGQIQAGRLAMQMYDDIPRGYAVAETNTSVDSEKLKLRGAISRYGFEPGQFSIEISNSPHNKEGNNLQHERLYLRDILKYRDKLPESEQTMLDALLNLKYGSDVRWEDLQGTKLLDFIRAEYSDLTNRLVETLSIPWRRIKALDTRSEIQNAPMPSYQGSIDSDIKTLLTEGNISPYITRQPVHVVKHEDGGPLYNKHNPIESFNGFSKIPVVRAGINVFDEGGFTEKDYPTEIQQRLQNGTIRTFPRKNGTHAYIRTKQPIQDLTKSIVEFTVAGGLMGAGKDASVRMIEKESKLGSPKLLLGDLFTAPNTPEYHKVKRQRPTRLTEFKHALFSDKTLGGYPYLTDHFNELSIPFTKYEDADDVFSDRTKAAESLLKKRPKLTFKNGGKINKFGPGGNMNTPEFMKIYEKSVHPMGNLDLFYTTGTDEKNLTDYFAEEEAIKQQYANLNTYLKNNVVQDITDLVRDGAYTMYPKEFSEMLKEGWNIRLFKDYNDRIYMTSHMFDKPKDDILSGFPEITYEELAKELPKRDYIGGTTSEARLKGLEKLPMDVKSYIKDLGKTYDINPNLLLHRFLKEGFIDAHIKFYNDNINTKEQKTYWSDRMSEIINSSIFGFDSLGLDDFYSNYEAGLYNLRRDFPIKRSTHWNEKGRMVESAIFDNLKDALEAKAADLEYRTKLAKSRGIPEEKLTAYINAMYNMGAFHKDLDNMEYVVKNYSFDPYYE